MVVDMQNAFASKGGMFDLSGIDISGARHVIEVLKEVLETARHTGFQVVYLQMGYDAKLTSSGGPESPNWHKELALLLMRKRPELKGKVLTEGQWDWEVVEELRPHLEDLVVNKTRYSGFCGTPLDSMLRTRSIKTLLFTGIATKFALNPRCATHFSSITGQCCCMTLRCRPALPCCRKPQFATWKIISGGL